MTRTQLICSVAIILLITVAGGAIHGRLHDLWGEGDRTNEAVRLLESLPDRFGSWQLVSRNELKQSELDMLRPYGYEDRTYINLDSGQEVSFFVLLGPVARTFSHSPEVCFYRREHPITEGKERVEMKTGAEGSEHLWCMTFQRRNLQGDRVRYYYGWSPGNGWEATSDWRLAYAGHPYLYKLQVATIIAPNADPTQPDTAQLLLHDLLPILRTHMLPAQPRKWLP